MKGWAGSYVAGPETAALTDGRWVRRGTCPQAAPAAWAMELATVAETRDHQRQEHDSGPGGATTPDRGLAGPKGTRPTHA